MKTSLAAFAVFLVVTAVSMPRVHAAPEYSLTEIGSVDTSVPKFGTIRDGTVTCVASSISPSCLAAAIANGWVTLLNASQVHHRIVECVGINDSGAIIALMRSDTNNSVAVSIVGGIVTQIGSLTNHVWSRAYAINRTGQVAAVSISANQTETCATVFSEGGLQNLGTLGGTYTEPRGMNDWGQTTGFSSGPGNLYTHAFLLTNGRMYDLGSLGSSSYGLDVNNIGLVVGYFSNGNAEHAFYYTDSIGMQKIPEPPGTESSMALKINALNQVVGFCRLKKDIGRQDRAFVFRDGNKLQPLGTLVPNGSSYAYGINNSGIIVGAASHGDIPTGLEFSGGDWRTHAVIFTESGEVIDLNNLIPKDSGWTLTSANAINNLGQIVGCARNPEGKACGFLLTPCPKIVFLGGSKGSLQFKVEGPEGSSYKIQSSTDMTNWSSLTTLPKGETQSTIKTETSGQRFYRAEVVD